jgi:hypothetical protein
MLRVHWKPILSSRSNSMHNLRCWKLPDGAYSMHGMRGRQDHHSCGSSHLHKLRGWQVPDRIREEYVRRVRDWELRHPHGILQHCQLWTQREHCPTHHRTLVRHDQHERKLQHGTQQGLHLVHIRFNRHYRRRC